MLSKPSKEQQWYAAVFVMLWLFLAKIIFFDLIVAVLVENFEVGETIRLIKEPGRISTFRRFLKASYRRISVIQFGRQNWKPKIYSDAMANARRMSIPKVKQDDDAIPNGTHYQLLLRAMTKTKSTLDRLELINEFPTVVIEETSLYLFGPTNRFRLLCIKIKDSQFFQSIIYSSIFVSCVMLLATPPAEDVPNLRSPVALSTRQFLNKVFTFFFAFEFLVNVISQVCFQIQRAYDSPRCSSMSSFFFHRGSYLLKLRI